MKRRYKALIGFTAFVVVLWGLGAVVVSNLSEDRQEWAEQYEQKVDRAYRECMAQGTNQDMCRTIANAR